MQISAHVRPVVTPAASPAKPRPGVQVKSLAEVEERIKDVLWVDYRYRWSQRELRRRRPQRSRGLPDLGERMPTPLPLGTPDEEPPPTPYRLPRLTPREVPENKIHWAGYRADTGPPPELRISSQKMSMTPKLYLEQVRRHHMTVPKFQGAMIAPVPSGQARYLATDDFSDEHFIRNLVSRSKVTQTGEPDILRLSDSRAQSPAKSSHGIHWTLSPHKHANFDRKGKLKSQGPYSREFAKTCGAPHNWLRMMYGRSKTFA